MKFKELLRIFLYALILLTAVLLSVLILLTGLSGSLKGAVATVKYGAALGVIHQNYVGDAEPAEITDRALEAALAALDDRWSYYMDQESYAAYQEAAANRYQGIGVTISKDGETGGFRIVAITKEGPAQAAGLVEGDIILAVDGIDVTAGEMEDIKALIQADYGGAAVVTVLRADGTKTDFTVSCEVIYDTPVAWSMLDGDVGYVRIENFRAGAAGDAIDAVESLREQGAERLVFDVRNNPGGQVSELVELLDYLLPEGDIFIRADRRGREIVERSDADCVELPMAVLINGQSYSAAEYFAAALREYDCAVLVGEATSGKARSQVTIPLFDKSALHLSRYTYLTPERIDLYEAGGLTPDVEAGLTEEEYADYVTGWLEPGEDPQVRAAIETLGA